MKAVTVNYTIGPHQSTTVGRLVYKDSLSYLELNDKFIEQQINLSPLSLTLEKNLQVAPRTPFNGLHGVFADSLPDGWGLLLMDRHFRQNKLALSELTPLDRLCYLGSRTMGALTYEPDLNKQDSKSAPNKYSLDSLAQESLEIITGSKEDISRQLQVDGGSPGGACPKSTIGLHGSKAISGANDLPPNYEHWLVKFPTGYSQEKQAEGVIEYIYSIMARDSGINFPQTQLIESDKGPGFFACKRFDRHATNQRRHIHSFAGLINADFRLPDSDYQMLIKATSHITKCHPDLCEVLRRMIFNVLSGNRDDHTKNFSFIMEPKGTWRLSPAYDVTFNTGINGQHSMSIKGHGSNIPKTAIAEIASMIPLNENKLNAIIEEVFESLSNWQSLAKSYQVPAHLIREIQSYINTQYQLLSA